MDSNAKDEINNILSKTRQMVAYVRTSRVVIKEGWCIFTAAFLKKIEYPMETNRLTNRNGKKYRITFSISLQKSRISPTFLRVEVYTSNQYHRLGTLHQWYNQQLKHLQTFIEKNTNYTPIGMLLIASAVQLRLEIGLLETMYIVIN